MREEIDILKKKCDRIDRLIRRGNVIFFGLECANKDLLQLVLNVFETRLKVGVTVSDLDDVCTIGKGKLNRPIIVRFVSHLKKREVLANVKLLKGTKLFLAEDLTWEERQRNKILTKHLREVRDKDLNAFLKGNRLFVNGEIYTAEDLAEKDKNDSLNVELQPRSSSAPATPTIRKPEIDELSFSPAPPTYQHGDLQMKTKQLKNEKGIEATPTGSQVNPKSRLENNPQPRKLRSGLAGDAAHLRDTRSRESNASCYDETGFHRKDIRIE